MIDISDHLADAAGYRDWDRERFVMARRRLVEATGTSVDWDSDAEERAVFRRSSGEPVLYLSTRLSFAFVITEIGYAAVWAKGVWMCVEVSDFHERALTCSLNLIAVAFRLDRKTLDGLNPDGFSVADLCTHTV